MTRPLECHSCGSPLDPSQRYCVECGARTRGLPAGVSATLAAIARGIRSAGGKAEGVPGGGYDLSTGPEKAPEEGASGKPKTTVPAKTLIGPFGWVFTIPEFELPTPRAMAAAVLGLLAFGVGIGAANIGLAEAPYDLIVNVFRSPSTTPANTVASTPSTSVTTPGATSVSNRIVPPASTNTGAGTSTTTTTTPTSTTTTTGSTKYNNNLPPVKHVWLITLSDQNYNTSLSRAQSNYLAQTLAPKGTTLVNYYGIGTGNLANNIGLLSGQAPNKQTSQNCSTYSQFKPSSSKQVNYQQLQGQGCVFPKSTPTLMSELQQAGYSWKAYVQGQGTKLTSVPNVLTAAQKREAARRRARATTALAREQLAIKLAGRGGIGPDLEALDAARRAVANADKALDPRVASETAATCRHPALGAKDPFYSGTSGYATWTNPPMYFQSVTGSKDCGKLDVGLNQLPTDLKTTATTPNLSLIYADPCDNGGTINCTGSASNGMTAAGNFLQSVVPQIMASAAYKKDGLILITFDQSQRTGPYAGISHYTTNYNPAYPNVTKESLSQGATKTYPVFSTGTCTSTTMPVTGTTTTGTTSTGTTGTGTGTGTTTTGTTTTPQCVTTTQQPMTCLNGSGLTKCSATGGGGWVGLLAISKYMTAGGFNLSSLANHFSLLFELQYLFELPKAAGNSSNPAIIDTDPPGIKDFFSNPTGK